MVPPYCTWHQRPQPRTLKGIFAAIVVTGLASELGLTRSGITAAT